MGCLLPRVWVSTPWRRMRAGKTARLDLAQGYVEIRRVAAQIKKPPRKRRRGGHCLRRAAPQTKTAAIAGGRFVGAKRVLRKTVIVRRRKRSWQVWQRPTLPNLEIQYHRRWGVLRPSSRWDRVQAPR